MFLPVRQKQNPDARRKKKTWTEKRPKLEAKSDLQVHAAVGGLVAKGTAGKRIGLAKNWRADHADGRSFVDAIENIARGNAQRKTVTLSGRVAAAKHSAATPIASASTARATRPAAECAARHRATSIAGGSAGFFSESKSLLNRTFKEKRGGPSPQLMGISGA